MKTALITGGTSGVGVSIAKSLLQKSYKVFLIGSNNENGKRVEASLDQKFPNQVEFIQLDLSSVRKTQQFAADFAKQHSKLDLLVNSAGIALPERTMTDEGNEKTFAVGYLSTFILSDVLAPLLERAEHGRISNVAGSKSFILNLRVDFDDLSFSNNYTTFKAVMTTVHAKAALTEVLAVKYADMGIDVNVFHPGVVKSNLTNSMKAWQRILFAVPIFFMSKESKTGIYVSASPELKGVTGKFFVNKKPMVLGFDDRYKQQLWEQTELLLSEVLA